MAVYLPLHWEPASKADRQLITDARPVRHWSGPFPRDVAVDQEEQLACGIVSRKRAFGLGHLAQLPVIALDTIGGIDQPPYLGTILKHRRQIFPMRFPRANRHWVAGTPSLGQLQQPRFS